MARETLNDFSETPADNTDIGGVAITGASPARNIDDAARAQAAILAKAVNGTTPVNDTWIWRDPDDTTKNYRHDAANIPTATERIVDAEHLFQIESLGARPIATTYYTSAASAQTHTFNTKAKYYRAFLMGAGGDGGNVDGQTPDAGGSASGGNSGNWGWTTYLSLRVDVGLEEDEEDTDRITEATYTVGAPGTAATGAQANGCDGDDTTWTDGTNSFTVKGGKGGIGLQAGGQFGVTAPVANSSNTGTLYETNYTPGQVGQGSTLLMVSVAGGFSPFGRCLPAGPVNGTGTDGATATGNGAGGGGAASDNDSNNRVGGRGAPGMIIVEEF